jgi:hypothetical protein
MIDPHDRRCFQCGHVQHCIDRVIPEVTCRNCGSNDTRAVKIAATKPAYEPGTASGNYIETLRYNWGNATDGSEWHEYLERKICELREGVRFWSYCTDRGMMRECPEKVEELGDFMMSLGIAPYSVRR